MRLLYLVVLASCRCMAKEVSVGGEARLRIKCKAEVTHSLFGNYPNLGTAFAGPLIHFEDRVSFQFGKHKVRY